MPETDKKATIIELMHIFKSVTDNNVNLLHKDITAGKHAEQEESIIYNRIASLQNCIYGHRFDQSYMIGAERKISDYENQACAIRKKINRGKKAAAELEQAQKFYETYQSITNAHLANNTKSHIV
jgi:hypothetical protein